MGVSQSDRQWQQRREQHLATGWELVIQLLVVIITMEDIKKAIGEAEKELEVAEKLVASKRSALMVLQKQLQDQLVKNVGGLKGVTSGGDKVNRNETEDERRARVRRRWRVLALKVKFGLGANVLAIKKRNLNDISTFIDQETEEATKEDQRDLEGKCMRKMTDKRHFRRGGVRVGCTEGRDGF